MSIINNNEAPDPNAEHEEKPPIDEKTRKMLEMESMKLEKLKER